MLLAAATRRRNALGLLFSLWLLLYFVALFSPPILDDADATHSAAARAVALTGDWVTLHVDGVRYLEKAPLPYWLAAISFRIFGFNTFAAHLPLALAVLALACLGYHWAARAFGPRAALYTGLFILTSAGIFLFTRIFLPEALLSLFLALALYASLRSLEENSHPAFAYLVPVAIACAVLTKGLVAVIFFCGTVILYLWFTGQYKSWRRIRPISATAFFLILAVPWHILAAIRNRNAMDGHGFLWFYFINEHVLRFLGRRIPMDYNKLPAALYWGLHLVWLFPWSIFLPLLAILAWQKYRTTCIRRPQTFAQQTALLLALYSFVVLIFFSLSTNQEYYTFPAWLPLLMLIAAALTRAEESNTHTRWLTIAHAALTIIGLLITAALAYGLWTARHISATTDIGDLLAHRGIGNDTLSMSHLFDLTGPSFAALRLPAAIAAAAFAIGPIAAWLLRVRHRHIGSTLAIALTATVFLIAAHIAFVRFAPMLSSKDLAYKIITLETTHQIDSNPEVILYGDQSYGSSIPFYLNQQVKLVDGRTTSMLFGSTFADAPPIFLTPADLLAQWGAGPRKILFVPIDRRAEADHLLGPRAYLLAETSGKALITDRPLEAMR